jgi:hypothetical protein
LKFDYEKMQKTKSHRTPFQEAAEALAVFRAIREMRHEYPAKSICHLMMQAAEKVREDSPKIMKGAPAHMDLYNKKLMAAARSWDSYSGDRDFPVPSIIPNPDPAYEYYAARVEKRMWKGAYGAARLELLDRVIAMLEREVK